MSYFNFPVGSGSLPLHGDEICTSNTNYLVLSASSNKEVRVPRYCASRPYVEILVPDGVTELHRIVFTIESHDQGYCGDSERHNIGSYYGSSTWFEAGVRTRPGRNDIPRKYVQGNLTAIKDYKKHTVTWDLCTADEASREWIKKIQSGDTIQLLPRAQWKAWNNFVKFAQIDIHCIFTRTDELKIDQGHATKPPKIGMDTVEKVKHNYRRYEKLEAGSKSIRLIILHSGTLDEPVVCDLIAAKIDETTEFEALSYCWGDQTDTKSMVLSHIPVIDTRTSQLSREIDPAFQITSSLDDALRNLRYEDGRLRTLWVDAVCINQSDLQERGSQVDMMGDIYAHASSVIVWLGESDESSRRAMGLVRTVSGQEFDWKSHYGGIELAGAYPRILYDVSRFFNYPWFRRVWVVQEVWKSKNAIVWCGSESVPFEKVVESNIFMSMGHAGGTPGIQLHTLPSIWLKLSKQRKWLAPESGSAASVLSNIDQRFPILDLVLEGTSLNATDARDKIYAMMGMSKENQLENKVSFFRSDYTKTVSHTFAELTRWWISEYKSLTILSAIHATKGRTWQDLTCIAEPTISQDSIPVGHPTWALWHEGDGRWAKRTLGMSGLYKAAAETSLLLGPAEGNHQELSLQGLRIGSVLSIHPYPYFQVKDPKIMQAYTRLFEPAGEHGTWNFGATITMDDGPHGKENQRLDMIRDHYASHWLKYPDTNQVEELSWRNGETNSWVKSSLPCHGKCFFRNSTGTFGLCPPMTRPGDIIVVLFGGSVPFILRKKNTADGSRVYELIGECYVQGQMEGAAIEEQKEGKLVAETFLLV